MVVSPLRKIYFEDYNALQGETRRGKRTESQGLELFMYEVKGLRQKKH
jgi:hypothetical protein